MGKVNTPTRTTCTLSQDELTTHRTHTRPTQVTVLRQEARATFLRAGRRHPTKEDLRHMGNTMNVMRETLRMHVVSMGVVRR